MSVGRGARLTLLGIVVLAQVDLASPYGVAEVPSHSSPVLQACLAERPCAVGRMADRLRGGAATSAAATLASAGASRRNSGGSVKGDDGQGKLSELSMDALESAYAVDAESILAEWDDKYVAMQRPWPCRAQCYLFPRANQYSSSI